MDRCSLPARINHHPTNSKRKKLPKLVSSAGGLSLPEAATANLSKILKIPFSSVSSQIVIPSVQNTVAKKRWDKPHMLVWVIESLSVANPNSPS